MRTITRSLSLGFILALSLASYASTTDPNSQDALPINLDDASFGDFQLINGQVVVSVDPEEPQASSCFPGLGFKMPSSTPKSLNNWWCNATSEYAFLGFSYEISACQSKSELTKDFKNIRNKFDGRYVRLYGNCDKKGYYDNVVDAAWDAGLGVHALIWFGFTGGNAWKTRRDELFGTLHSNHKAKFVTRVVQFGSEPLFDDVLPHAQLAEQVIAAKKNLSSLHIPVTVSELAYGYQERGGAQDVLNAIDSINIHMLPFFDKTASTSNKSWPLVLGDLDWFIARGKGKKMYMDENGWPSKSYPGVEPNS
ncbi:hypothetical protein HWV62_34111 [Athelia sp. TMB]|nr:hypothetical protein HWV62_34111 [Athelia sp. TMB]